MRNMNTSARPAALKTHFLPQKKNARKPSERFSLAA